MSVLLYGSECWKVSKMDGDKLNIFHNIYLRRIQMILWQNVVPNKELYMIVGMGSTINILKGHRRKWIGLVLRMEPWNDCRIALT